MIMINNESSWILFYSLREMYDYCVYRNLSTVGHLFYFIVTNIYTFNYYTYTSGYIWRCCLSRPVGFWFPLFIMQFKQIDKLADIIFLGNRKLSNNQSLLIFRNIWFISIFWQTFRQLKSFRVFSPINASAKIFKVDYIPIFYNFVS